MSKTSKFNVTVHLGKTSYLAGKDVPIGGKGLSEDEAKKLEDNFGIWTASEGAADVDDAVANLKAQLAAARLDGSKLTEVTAEVVRLEGLLSSRPTIADLNAEKQKVEQLEDDAAALAGEVAKLTTSGVEKDARIQTLEDDAAALADEVTKLATVGAEKDARIQKLEADLAEQAKKAPAK